MQPTNPFGTAVAIFWVTLFRLIFSPVGIIALLGVVIYLLATR